MTQPLPTVLTPAIAKVTPVPQPLNPALEPVKPQMKGLFAPIRA